MTIEPFVSYIGAAITMLVSFFVWIFTKPTEEEKRINLLRKNLLTQLRFKVSYEISKTMPVKEIDSDADGNFEDYIAIAADKLNSYLTSNSYLLELFFSETLFKSYIRTLRIFKYSIIIIPIVCMAIFVVLQFVFLIVQIYPYVIAVVVALVSLIAIFFTMERRKDKYHDLCSKYEIMHDS